MAFKVPTSTKENPAEMYFRWYLEELHQEGFIKSFQREAETFSVLPSVAMKRNVYMKTKSRVESFNLFQETTYTYDFRIVWNETAKDLFYELIDINKPLEYDVMPFKAISLLNKENETHTHVSYIDVKPHYKAVAFGGGKNSTFYTFPFIQKMLFYYHNIYVNKITPNPSGKHGVNTCLFAKTFCPKRFYYTDGGKDLRKIPFKKTPLNSYIIQMNKHINGIKNLKQNYPDNQTELF